ncbi:MAG: hypothetical protein ABEJ72_05890, partial [Candidatus Aenigmatarchaeota archaeon]
MMTARRRGYSLEPYKEGLYIAEKNGVQIVGDHIEAISGAYEEDYLSFDIEGKNVLDIGGHLGTTATLFKKIGECNKVYVYEPVEPKREIIE